MIEFQKVSFSYEKKQVIQDLSFSLKNGEILGVMGPSGCGKTTLLSLAAGLRKPNAGKIVTNAKKISYVFQEPRLFPWLTVTQNLQAVAEKEKFSSEQIQQALHEVGLEDWGDAYPSQLSGGMKSRVSIARALLYGGDLFLLDEPFSALDEEMRKTLSLLLRKKICESGASAILVTHQRADAEAMADRILELTPLAK